MGHPSIDSKKRSETDWCAAQFHYGKCIISLICSFSPASRALYQFGRRSQSCWSVSIRFHTQQKRRRLLFVTHISLLSLPGSSKVSEENARSAYRLQRQESLCFQLVNSRFDLFPIRAYQKTLQEGATRRLGRKNAEMFKCHAPCLRQLPVFQREKTAVLIRRNE